MRTIATNEPTRYEVVAEHSDGRRYLVGYVSGSPSRRHLLGMMRQQGDALIKVCAIGETDEMTFGTKPRPHAKVCGWCIRYSGATQRDVFARRAELPFVRDVARCEAA